MTISVFQNNIAPSLKHVLKSPTFYIVALAHTGSCTVRTSERILGTYYKDTSLDTLSENRSGGLAVFLSFGTISGLMLAGSFYSKGTERQRKRLVTKLYIATIVAAYILAMLAIPWLQSALNAPELVLVFQVMATFCLGFSIAVPFYQSPSLVGATYGCDKGLYAGYTDGVANALSSLVWRIVGSSVEHDESMVGWVYGWAAVALLLIVSALVMPEFMEHYYVRPGLKASEGYETIMFA
jgi:MFS family permease